MISIQPPDRSFLRFLWWDIDNPKQLQVYRHSRVVFGLTSSPFLLGATIEMHLEKTLKSSSAPVDKIVVGKLQKSYYVDNCVTSVNNEADFTVFHDTSIRVMASGGFNLRSWEYTGQTDAPQQSCVLGMTWDKLHDTLSLKEIPQDKFPDVVTKRFILSSSHKIFDCLGLVCPVLVYPKLLLRKLHTNKDWDTVVDKEDQKAFAEWYSQLYLLKEIRIPRWMFSSCDEVTNISFHVFVDASLLAYAAVVYVRIESSNNVAVHFVQAKSRVTPTTSGTIPRLELLAATIGVRLLHSIVRALGYEDKYKTYYWSDSTTVISWIKRDWQWRVFVQNRVREIKRLSKPEQWHFIPGDDNPADLPSRGCDAKFLIQSKWHDGPGWLKLAPNRWPAMSEFIVDENEVCKEKKKLVKVDKDDVVFISHDVAPESSCWYTRYFSNYNKIVHMIGWIKRFILNCRLRGIVRTRSKTRRVLSSKEYHDAEITLLKLLQSDTFSGSADSRLANFDIQVDETGLLRIKTPISDKIDEFSFRFPIVLDSNHILVTRLIRYEHVKNRHAGVLTLLNMLREKYWILRGRKAIRRVVNTCVVCKRYSTKRIQEVAPALPENRVNTVGVFQVVGIDYAGPLYLKDKKKVWICLFTCAVYRAVHLELVSSLLANDFLQAFRRFVARRGTPKVVYSDNGTNFVSASKFLLDIEWHFNVPSAPWWGGFFERLIRVVKDLLRKILNKSVCNYEEMLTLLCECESVVNSRPITYLCDDPREPGPLTPSMFLRFTQGDTQVYDLNIVNGQQLSKSYRRLLQIKDSLKKRFRNEYLGSLRSHPKCLTRKGDIEIGDVVLIGDTDKRLLWPLAKVLELIPGRDGKVRVVKVRTSRGVLTRPVQRIYPLELSEP